ncbi:MAG: glycoside hydrolase family 38 C-terminal domain-containing protein [Gemmatimonadota bacterium]
MEPHQPHTIVVVSHTHWDREWYHPLGVMRQRLVALVDSLLDAPDGLPFLLDGQAIVLDDYRAMRPERTPALHAALRDGRIEAGPWYVLADMLIPSGEALVRNLLEGVQTVHEAWGDAPRVLYSPDAFGHSAAGPVLAAGFGLEVAILWRGFGGPPHPSLTVVRWTHPSGAGVLTYHLPPNGYEVGSSLPTTPTPAAARWRAMRDAVLGVNPLRVALLPNGADHHARQPARPDAIAALGAVAAPHTVVSDSLSGFAARLVRAAVDVPLSNVRGELRDSTGWTWSLQGTFATRAHQKRTNAQVERLLVRDAEPWAALAWYTNGWSRSTLRMAWKTLLATHPHDTLCGCSVDEVALSADRRWADARAQAEGIRDDALRALVGCDSAAQRAADTGWHPMLVLRNPAARNRGGAVRLRLVDAPVPDPVGPGSAGRSAARMSPPPTPASWTADALLQLLQRSRQFDRVESPLHYPHNAVVRVSDVMAWIEPLPGHAVQPVWLTDLHAVVRPVPARLRVRASEAELHSESWRITPSAGGPVATHAATGAQLQPLGWLESTTDAGDTYTPALRGDPLRAQWAAPRLLARGPLRAEWEQEATLERPRMLIAPATEPAAREIVTRDVVTVTATATLALTAGTDWIDVTIRGDNTAGDHRLRWVLPLPAGLQHDHVVADAAFGAVRRDRSARDPREWNAETRLATAPLHRWLHLSGESFGLGIVSDGLAEYELLPEGQLAITLLRAVGELSRRDVPGRPGHAGWPMATPAAQSLGAFEARFAIVVLPQDVDAAREALEQVADDVLLPVTGDTWRGVASPLEPCSGLTLEGEGLTFSTAKRSDDGQWLVLRCVNQRGTPVRGIWHLPRAATEVRHSRLDETPGLALTGTGPRIRFEAAPHAIVTLLVR